MTSVFLVMGNDYPHAIFSTEDLANVEVARLRAADNNLRDDGTKPAYWPGINWRVYDFELDPEVEAADGYPAR